jgi:peptidoglycan/LPS O-acetylase OafA/YrhL
VPSKKSELKYRADIDGLRAVAVVIVMLFHLDIGRFTGGFVGVDVFFVISGYLISSIIFTEISESRFSIVGFYERRIRRIFPALLALFAVFALWATLFFLPSELVDLQKSMLAATFSASNFYFWQHSSYFDAPLSQPLLHTWSLAVEEQFYLAFPLFLWLVRALFPKRLRNSVLAIFFLSLAASIVVVYQNRTTAFYMPYTRAWELLLGTLLSMKLLPRLQALWMRNLATLIGAGLIAFAAVRYTPDTPFPGFGAIAPCVGTALIIWAGDAGSSLVGAFLSLRPVVFVGLISYSLYLWHWPVIVSEKMGLLLPFGSIPWHWATRALTLRRYDALVEVTVSFVLAVLSWRFVERPFRIGRLRLGGRPLFALAGAAILLLAAFSAWTIFAGGFKGRFPPDAVNIAAGGKSADQRVGICFITPPENHFENYSTDVCLREQQGEKNYLALGDSHAAMLWPALVASLPEANVMQANTTSCKPLLHPEGSGDCKKMMSYIFQSYLPSHPVQGLFLIGRWIDRDMSGITETIDWARQQNVPAVIFGPMPEYDGPLPRLLAYSIAWNRPGLASEHRVPANETLDVEMQQMAAETWHIPYVSLYRDICDDKNCAEYADAAHRVPLMDDSDHLNRLGALFVVKRIVERRELQ